MKFKVYFELFGRNMRTEVEAYGVVQAKEEVTKLIAARTVFKEVVQSTVDVDFIKNFLGIK